MPLALHPTIYGSTSSLISWSPWPEQVITITGGRGAGAPIVVLPVLADSWVPGAVRLAAFLAGGTSTGWFRGHKAQGCLYCARRI